MAERWQRRAASCIMTATGTLAVRGVGSFKVEHGRSDRIDALRTDLVTAAKNMTTRRRRRRRAGVTTLLLAVIAGVLFTTAQPSSASVLEVQYTGNSAEVRLKDLAASAPQIAKELNKAGIQAQVSEVPVATPVVGHFVGLQTSGFDPNFSIVDAKDTGSGFTTFRVTRNEQSRIDLKVGRAAQANESYDTPFNSYDTGGRLHCSGLWDANVSDAQNVLQRMNVHITWRVKQADGLVDVDPSAFGQYKLVEVFETAPNAVQALATSDGAPVYLNTQVPAACNG